MTQKKHPNYSTIILILAMFSVFWYALRYARSPVDFLSTPIPSGWETYDSNEYSFSHPQGLKSDTDAGGQGVKSIRFQYIGNAQLESGRTQTELFSGYSFTVTKIESTIEKTSKEYAETYRNGSLAQCDYPGANVSEITETRVSGIPAYAYTISGCGSADSTSTYVEHEGNMYAIYQNYSGSDQEVLDHERTTDQILSTLRFK